MNFTISTKTFAAALNRVQGITSGRTTMPILSHVLLQVWPKALHVVASDLEVSFTTVVEDLTVNKPGKVALPARKLLEIVSHIPTETVTLQLKDNDFVLITGGTARFNIVGLCADEFPQLPDVKGDSLNVDFRALRRLLDNVDYCMSRDETRYNLSGVYLRIDSAEEGKSLVAVATDGHRLALDRVPLPGEDRAVPADLAKGIIISRKGVIEMKKLRPDSLVVMNIAGNTLALATDAEKLYLRLVDGEFPDFQRIIPAATSSLEVKRLPLVDAVERVAVVAPDKTSGILFGIEDGAISLSATNAELGESSDRVSAAVNCSPVNLRLSATYVMQALNAWDCGVVTVHVGSDLAPIMVTPISEKEPLAVIMPMRM